MKNRLIFLLLSVFLVTSYKVAAQGIPSSFSKSKALLYKQVYANKGTTFYTGCAWSRKKVDLSSCHLENAFPKSQSKRSKRIEAEHIIPASWMYKVKGSERACVAESKRFKDGPRDYCQKHDTTYRDAHNDLVNLRPAVGSINGYRSNKPFAEVVSGKKETTYNTPYSKTILSSRVIIPDAKIRGDIARVAFYMQDTYGITYSKRQQRLFEKWHLDDPVSPEERELNQRILRVQGKANHFVK